MRRCRRGRLLRCRRFGIRFRGRLLRQAAGKRLQLRFYEEDAAVACDWCAILEFDGGWANVEFVREKKGQRERRLIPLSSIRSITFLPEGEG